MGELERVLRREERAIYSLRALYGRYGYRPYRVNKFEEYDFYARNKSFLVSDSVLTFADTDGRLMALKPDVTLSIVKNAKDTETALQKFCYNETVYRPSGADRGFREIMQAGLECIGDLDLCALGEVVTLAAESLAAISDRWLLDLSHLGVLSAVLEPLPGGEAVRRELLRLIGEKDRHDIEAVCAGAGISKADCGRLQALAQLHAPLAEALPELERLCGDGAADALRELRGIAAMLGDCGLLDRVVLDLSAGGDMRYYNGLLLQGFVDGIPAPILSGGRYDGLMRQLGKRGGAVGFAVYLDQLERFEPRRDYDVDILLLYDEGADPLEVRRAVRRLQADGRSVRAERNGPGSLRYRELWRLTGKEAARVADDA